MRTAIFFFILLMIISCRNARSKQLVLKRIVLTENIEIDTLEKYHSDSLLLVNIIRNGHLGNFRVYCGYIRSFKSKSVIYQADNFEPFVISRNYIAQRNPDDVDPNIHSGWFNIGDSGKLKTSLPNEKELMDSLKSNYSPNYFVNSNNSGDFFIYERGKLIRTINYGNLVLQDSSIDFNQFDSEIFKLEGGKLHRMTFSDPEDIYNNGKGLYYVARPGLGVIKKVEKGKINKILMSYRTSSDCPDRIEIK